MPSLVRKLLIVAVADGLILQPSAAKHHQTPSTKQAIKIDWKGNIGPQIGDRSDGEDVSISQEAHGIIGLLQVANSRFLISICDREPAAQIRGKFVYKITQVALIPLSSQAEANKAIASAQDQLKKSNRFSTTGADESDGESGEDAPSVTDSLLDEDAPVTTKGTDMVTGQKGDRDEQQKTTVAEDVMQRKGVYGRFADKWFSRKGWGADNRRLQGLSSEEDLRSRNVPKNVESVMADQPTAPTNPDVISSDDRNLLDPISPSAIPQAPGAEKDATTLALLPKILQTTNMYFSSGNFFFSYDYDISHGIGKQTLSSHLPLFKQFDPLFFWNQHIISPFIDAGQHSFVLPIMQGFVGQRLFNIKTGDADASLVLDSTVSPDDIQLQAWHEKQKDADKPEELLISQSSIPDNKDFSLVLISRRSTKRAGLRYLRRGTDDEGCTANSVESEQILSAPTWSTTHDKIFSFTQYRGSIPLFFSQSPYSLKPQVNTWGSFETNAGAFKRHFIELASRYGNIHCASLIDKHGNEAKIGELYEKHAKALNDNGGLDGKGKKLGFEWFDFHNVCRGMRFENVSKLMESIEPFMKSASWVEIAHDEVVREQTGVLRTNCMDCLDRTNVVQSACARTALEAQLSAGNYNIDLQHDPSTSWFNTLWADNGDAISRQYAGTAALKGDFTRTRKRQFTGALTDFGLTLTRYYNNIVNDYFTQAVIDHLLGTATDTIFAEFEADMKSSDYFIDVRKVRQQAIDRCAGIVIEDHDEDLTHGWTLSVPTSVNQVKTASFEEAILLLTNKALYFCRLDWGTEKVREFERIRLEDIQGIMRGVYITSTLAQRHMDTDKNVGFIIRYRADRAGTLVRRNTRALDASSTEDTPNEPPAKAEQKQGDISTGRFLAFKGLPPLGSSSGSSAPESEGQVVKSICDEIVRAANRIAKETQANNVDGDGKERSLEVEEKDIISLSDARKTTTYLEQLEYSLKKLVWG
ncbi:hypothetical protein IAQ61_004989 [Plenodomus lingam]|uniref:uncharacterized protein n=1 Tax=Leptosphaeria maculans TaxID=5022 RepID=UPI003324ECED|nr:hypothetical protein IAQ61_004989 [Plenodomus lingam]